MTDNFKWEDFKSPLIYRPTQDSIIIGIDKTEIVRGGLHVPESAQRPNIATVIDVGPEVKYVRPGQKIAYMKSSEFAIPVDYENSVNMITERGVLLIWTDQK